MAKQNKTAAVSAGLHALTEMVPVWDRAVLGTIGQADHAKVCHLISSGCHARLGYEDNKPMPWGEMILAVLAAAGRDGMTVQDTLVEAAVVAAGLLDDSNAVVARAADDAARRAADSEGY
jgi:hypothetical protein